ncbi:MAG: hypothetical protein IT270_11770, partial [Saprospiraceae bacterium]|nr:hypothetical protein [Saprospiraceae bacterium]
MKPIVTLAVFSFFSFTCSLRGQNLFVETFTNGFGTNGWTAESGWVTGTSATISSADFSIPAHTVFAGINDDAMGETTQSSGAITSPMIDLTGQAGVVLKFDAYFINGDWEGSNETAKVFIRPDTSATWTLLKDLPGNTSWHTYKIFIPSQFAGNKVYVSFAYDDDGAWNYGFCVDNVSVDIALEYDGAVEHTNKLEYTRLTPNQSRPLVFENELNNLGFQALTDVSMVFRASVNNVIIEETTQLFPETTPGETTQNNFSYMPENLGSYSFRLNASHSTLGNNFYVKNYLNVFRLDSTVMAKDDNTAETHIGMSFGNPVWYGYYGNEFDLIANDTLIGIDVKMAANTAGSFNLKVAEKDEVGLPTIELFHSENIPISSGFNGWVHYTLPVGMPIDSGNYVFCVGQDAIQGVMGHGFDNSKTNPSAWIISPVAGGGYPWNNYTATGTLM